MVGHFILIIYSSDVSFSQFSNTTFHHNRTLDGAAILVNHQSNITLMGNSMLLFVNNQATQSGGAGYFNSNCYFTIKEKVIVTFDRNKA